LAAPPKTPPALQAGIGRTVVEILTMPDAQARFRSASVEPTPKEPRRDGRLHQGGSPALGRDHQQQQGLTTGDSGRAAT
jgi:hypothetical protein